MNLRSVKEHIVSVRDIFQKLYKLPTIPRKIS